MRVAIIAPLWERIPPEGYGGIEIYIYDLVEGLIKKGIDVTLFASKDSQTKAHLEPICPRGLRTDYLVKNPQAYYSLMMGRVFSKADKFDIIHNHTDHNALPYSQFIDVPMVTHLHGPFVPERVKVYKEYNNTYFISISKNQQQQQPKLNYVANIYHGIPVEKFEFNDKPGDHLVWLGRISPQKDTRGAIEVARRTGRKLILAGKIDKVDEEYYEEEVRPYIDGEQIHYIGELGFADKIGFLKDAWCMLMPLTWQEPFGLVMIEALACGTPVIASNMGSVPEIIQDGKTGFIVSSISQMIKKVDEISKISRRACRKYVEKNFTQEKMISEHIKAYKEVIKRYKKEKKK